MTAQRSFIFLGPDKSGSTWLYRVLAWHPEVFTPAAKELFYFDRYYDRGRAWYESFYADAASDHKVLADISHDYLFSGVACDRIVADLDDPLVMVTLREPIGRAYSAYRYMQRQGRVVGSFEAALVTHPELIDHGRYGKHLPRWDERCRGRLHIGLFDDLQSDSNTFAQAVFRFLAVSPLSLPDDLRAPALTASAARSPRVAKMARGIGVMMRDAGFPVAVNRVKNSSMVEHLLYRRDAESVGVLPTTVAHLREELREDVEKAEQISGLPLMDLWGYRT